MSTADCEVLVEYYASDHAYVSTFVSYHSCDKGTRARLRTETILHIIYGHKKATNNKLRCALCPLRLTFYPEQVQIDLAGNLVAELISKFLGFTRLRSRDFPGWGWHPTFANRHSEAGHFFLILPLAEEACVLGFVTSSHILGAYPGYHLSSARGERYGGRRLCGCYYYTACSRHRTGAHSASSALLLY